MSSLTVGEYITWGVFVNWVGYTSGVPVDSGAVIVGEVVANGSDRPSHQRIPK